MPIFSDTVTRGIAANPNTIARVNKIGAPVTSVTGTPTRQGIWTLTILNGPDSTLNARVTDCSTTTMRPVKVSTAYTDLIPGATITLHSSLNHGDMASIIYTREYIVNT